MNVIHILKRQWLFKLNFLVNETYEARTHLGDVQK
jgi:hypothetical protein